MAFPTVASETTGGSSTNTTAHGWVVPTGTLAGELLLVIIGFDENFTRTFPTGWTRILELQNGSAVVLEVGYRFAQAGDADSTVTYTTGSSDQSRNRCMRISGAHASTPPAVSAGATGTSTAPAPDVLDPSGWATEDTLWIAAAAIDNPSSAVTTVTYPTSYTNGAYSTSGTTAGSMTLATARRERAIASEGPGAFGTNASQPWVANTIGIRPVTAAPPAVTHPDLVGMIGG